jgi:hypothetical protein
MLAKLVDDGLWDRMINDHTLTRFTPLGDRLLKPIYE